MITMSAWLFAALVLLFIAAVVGMWASGVAQRLNRLHIRTDAARISLQGALDARAAVVEALQPELAEDVNRLASTVLRATNMGSRSDAENAVARRLDSSVLANSSFISASTRVDLAARFYNEAVADTRSVRARPAVRVLKLAGRAPLPEFYEALTTDHHE
ncbi:putative secreted protein [Corynebacterium resistens DSM 45100]|uniref:Secreted protein n=1 Tax=Corynebacterium resistens (strain DSM 45100 / JCM 12819 / GTC 2026 / SICGH 158) TaxID=662755 RepID=F8DXI9_CORRG|nr:hypothetical protein [Corynebacterium resistens]AEI09498.1 putative secreted protein [Corynebacterium resistens DSM 45100]